jgi:hypothetical protein
MTEKAAFMDFPPSSQTWEATPELRFIWKGSQGFQRAKILQQAWKCSDGVSSEWRDVPLVEE